MDPEDLRSKNLSPIDDGDLRQTAKGRRCRSADVILMKRSRYPILSALILILAALASLSAGAAQTGLSIDRDREVLFQVSTIDALLLAVYDGVLPVGELKEKGDFGIGTFDKLAGEMILLDGVCYQVKEDGVAYVVSDYLTTPFASVTFFDHDETVLIEEAANLTEFVGILEASLPSKNAFYAVRFDGTFPFVRKRSVPAQERPYPLLADAVSDQTVFEFVNASGTIIGFWTPQFAAGIHGPGSHLRFITDDRTAGGHILDLRVDGVEVALDVTASILMALPTAGDFFDLDLTGDLSADLEKVEK